MTLLLLYMALFRVCELAGIVIMARRFGGTRAGILGSIGFALLFFAACVSFVPFAASQLWDSAWAIDFLNDTLPEIGTILGGVRALGWVLIFAAILFIPVPRTKALGGRRSMRHE